jgi:lauroyl/myristoyl acyltransferase
MILYLLYRLGVFLALALPVKTSHAAASCLAGIFYSISRADREAVLDNLKVVTGGTLGADELRSIARDVFRNFAKYLADFFRFSRIGEEYVKGSVELEGFENVDKALGRGKGAVMLSAHIGNWELGGHVLSLLRQPMAAVVLTHQNKKINDFFIRQRTFGNLQPIEIGAGLRTCYQLLKDNGLLAVLGDRDFSKKGIYVDFFGRPTLIPKGPAVLSYRTGAAIVPAFMIRQEDDTYKFFFEEPILPDQSADEAAAIEALAKRYTDSIERCVKKYPNQWFVFRKVWNDDGKQDLRPDTII